MRQDQRSWRSQGFEYPWKVLQTGYSDRLLARSNDDVCRLGALGTLGNLEFDLIAFVKHLESVLLNGGKVNEDVISIVPGNEPKALLFIEPLHSTFGHYKSPPFSLNSGKL